MNPLFKTKVPLAPKPLPLGRILKVRKLVKMSPSEHLRLMKLLAKVV